jgi:hypothetical protein
MAKAARAKADRAPAERPDAPPGTVHPHDEEVEDAGASMWRTQRE